VSELLESIEGRQFMAHANSILEGEQVTKDSSQVGTFFQEFCTRGQFFNDFWRFGPIFDETISSFFLKILLF
jgi:hypothetical protein